MFLKVRYFSMRAKWLHQPGREVLRLRASGSALIDSAATASAEQVQAVAVEFLKGVWPEAAHKQITEYTQVLHCTLQKQPSA
jgi:hypothetical protein